MRILTVGSYSFSEANTGGSERQLIHFENHMQNKGHEIYHLNIYERGSYPVKTTVNSIVNYNLNTVGFIRKLLSFFIIIYFINRHLKNKFDLIYTREYYFHLPLIFISKSFCTPIFFVVNSKKKCFKLFRGRKFKISYPLASLLYDFLLYNLKIVCLNEEQSRLIKLL